MYGSLFSVELSRHKLQLRAQRALTLDGRHAHSSRKSFPNTILTLFLPFAADLALGMSTAPAAVDANAAPPLPANIEIPTFAKAQKVRSDYHVTHT